MRLELTGRHVDITPDLRRFIDTKLNKLERLLNDRAVSAQCVLKQERHRHCIELTLHARGETFLHAVADAGGWESAVTNGVARLVHQAGKIKGKWQGRKRRASKGEASVSATATGAKSPARARTSRPRAQPPRIIETTRHAPAAMSLADATRALAADSVVIFRDVETSLLSVLYRRSNGQLALVETETE
ncbi:MAG TPA: ribosome-associated translation inhibitor RaiA [Vicinamibacterales bacterium]|jgi:putative sigma-54 modulation protein